MCGFQRVKSVSVTYTSISFKTNLGPLAPVLTDVPPNPRQDGLGYNPRCLRRDINPNSSKFTSEAHTYDLLTQNPDIYWFQTVMQGEMEKGQPGVHGGGHFTISGDPGGVSQHTKTGSRCD